MKTKNIIISVLIILIVLAIQFLAYGYYQKTLEVVKNPIAKLEIEGYGTVLIELYPDKAPETVANFIKLANDGYYNGLTFHRTLPDTLIQGGDKAGTGSGQSDYTIVGEFAANGYKANNLKHEAGIISMARGDYSSIDSSLTTQGYNSASTQFFITVTKQQSFDGLYAAFGKVIQGLDVIQAVSSVEVETRKSDEEGKTADKPINPPVIKSLSVETYGVDYGEPVKLKPFDYYNWLIQNYGGGLTGEE